MSLLIGLGAAPLVAWAGVVATRRGFWRADQRLDTLTTLPTPAPPLAVVIPARDEAQTIAVTVRSLLNQSYPGPLHVVVVDDNSIDGTAEAAREGAQGVSDGPHRFSVVTGKPLPPGWSGKLWAVHQGVEAVERLLPDARYILLTDADIEHAPGNIARLISQCERRGLVMASLMVKLRCRSRWEHLLIPAFVFFFQKLYPFPQVNDPDHPQAAAAGGCLLVRRAALDAIGGIESIRGALIDDCALAARLKEKGPIWLGLAGRTRSLRVYDALGDVWSMVARTAYVQLRRSPLLLLATVLGMTLLYLLPPLVSVLGLALGNPVAAGLGAAGWIGMAALYWPTLRLYRRPPLAGLALPVAALLYTAMTLDSARRHYLGRGGEWKGRAYAGAGLDAASVAGPALSSSTASSSAPSPCVTPETGAPAGREAGQGDAAAFAQTPVPGSAAEEAENRALAAHVEAITRASGTSFYGAMRILPRERRESMYALYAFCRVVDDIADGADSEAEKRAQLAHWRDEIAALYDPERRPTDPVARALEGPRWRHALPQADFLAVIEGMEMDAGDRVRLEDVPALERYCDRVACAVGRLSNRIFGVEPALIDDIAHHTGLALQLINVLRDVAEDARRDRLYLPLNRLRAHGVTDTDDLQAVLAHPGTARVCAELAGKAAAELAEADRLHALCHRRTIRPAVIMKEVYRRYWQALVARGWDRLDQPVSVSKGVKLAIVVRHGLL